MCMPHAQQHVQQTGTTAGISTGAAIGTIGTMPGAPTWSTDFNEIMQTYTDALQGTITPPSAPSPKPKAPPQVTVDARAVALVIKNLDMPKEAKAKLATEFMEALSEQKVKFHRETFLDYVKELSQ